jgi:alpha-beta hydrolase superfamily lysophospholipase
MRPPSQTAIGPGPYVRKASTKSTRSFRYNALWEKLLAHLGKHAIVIGASMGGLLAARALADFSSNLRRRYERLSHFPEGFLVFGDALCSFNPIFGQGMTVACMESMALRNCLKNGQQGLAKQFFRATSRIVDVPWQITVGSDLQNPQVEGKRTMQVRFINWYIAKFFQAAQYDGLTTGQRN